MVTHSKNVTLNARTFRDAGRSLHSGMCGDPKKYSEGGRKVMVNRAGIGAPLECSSLGELFLIQAPLAVPQMDKEQRPIPEPLPPTPVQ